MQLKSTIKHRVCVFIMSKQVLTIISILCASIVLLFNNSLAEEFSSSGFYYPLKTDSPKFEKCGRWLERPSPNGCYPDNEAGVYHTGSDMMASYGSPVYAIADGVVALRSPNGWGKNNVALLIEHRTIEGEEFRAIYGHIVSNKQENQSVKSGEIIGTVGNWDGGDHLHFGVLSIGLDFPIDSSHFGRWFDSKWGVATNNYYDNGLVDPIWFITHNAPNNWITREEINPNNLTYPISPTNPYFYSLCIAQSPFDPRCNTSNIVDYIECVNEGSTLCSPPTEDYSAISGGGGSSGCPSCAGGDDPGDSGTTSGGPDANVKLVEIDNTGNNWHHSYTAKPGQNLQVRVRVTNKGDETIDYFEVFIHRSGDLDFNEDSDYSYGREEEEDDLDPGDGTNKHRAIKAPNTPGRYYIFAYINRVDGKEGGGDQDWSNNYSRNDDPEEYAVLTVMKPNLLIKNVTFGDGSLQVNPSQQVDIVVDVFNDGTDPGRDAVLAFYLSEGEAYHNPTSIGTRTMPGTDLELWETRTESISFAAPSEPGNYTVSVYADSTSVIDEGNEEDNWHHIVFTVRDLQAEIRAERRRKCLAIFPAVQQMMFSGTQCQILNELIITETMEKVTIGPQGSATYKCITISRD